MVPHSIFYADVALPCWFYLVFRVKPYAVYYVSSGVPLSLLFYFLKLLFKFSCFYQNFPNMDKMRDIS